MADALSCESRQVSFIFSGGNLIRCIQLSVQSQMCPGWHIAGRNGGD